MQLAIDIGFRHMIEIEQGETANAAARQGLDSPGADTPNADDRHPRLLKTSQALLCVEPRNAAKTSLEIHQGNRVRYLAIGRIVSQVWGLHYAMYCPGQKTQTTFSR
jgi:hypothetical protein